jgi:hypothetical protein
MKKWSKTPSNDAAAMIDWAIPRTAQEILQTLGLDSFDQPPSIGYVVEVIRHRMHRMPNAPPLYRWLSNKPSQPARYCTKPKPVERPATPTATAPSVSIEHHATQAIEPQAAQISTPSETMELVTVAEAIRRAGITKDLFDAGVFTGRIIVVIQPGGEPQVVRKSVEAFRARLRKLGIIVGNKLIA